MKRLPGLAPLAALTLALALGEGCTSDDPNGVGTGLSPVGMDSVLVPVTLTNLSHYGALNVTNTQVPLDEREVLYLGSDGNDASSIVVTYDFSTLPNAEWTEDLLAAGNIINVRLRMYLLTWYNRNHGANTDTTNLPNRYWPGARKIYRVFRLAAPVDTLSFPGAEPAFAGVSVDSFVATRYEDLYPKNDLIEIPIYVDKAAEWLAERGRISFLIREEVDPIVGTDPGLLGFASKEMVHGGSTLADIYAGNSIGPTLLINTTRVPDIAGVPDPDLVIRPVADVSTWHALEEPPATPATGILFRTHMRSYPVLGFDLSDTDLVPRNVRINRAELTLVTDTTRVSGPAQVLVASEIEPDVVPPGVAVVALADLEPATFVVGGRSGLNPEDAASDIIAINVTSSVQRFLNGAYAGSRVFLLTEGESFFTGWRANPSPDFWFRRRWFYGTDDADPAHRPRLKIVYSRESELDEVRP